MAKIEDVDNTSLLFSEQASAPTTPATGKWRAYFKSDGLYIVDDAGTETGPFAESTSAPTYGAASYKKADASYSTTSTTFVDVDGTNMSLTITTGARRVLIGFVGSVRNDTAGQSVALDVTVDGTRQGNDHGLVSVANSTSANGSFSYLTAALSAGSHTFKLQYCVVGSGTARVFGSSTSEAAQFWVQEMP